VAVGFTAGPVGLVLSAKPLVNTELIEVLLEVGLVVILIGKLDQQMGIGLVGRRLAKVPYHQNKLVALFLLHISLEVNEQLEDFIGVGLLCGLHQQRVV